MTRNLAALFVLAAGLCAGAALAKNSSAPAVRTSLAIYQTRHSDSSDVLLYCDTMDFVKGVRAIGFITAFSVELEYDRVDTGQASLTAQVVTLSQPPSNYSKHFEVEYGLPARLDGIRGKSDAVYSLRVTPIKRIAVDTAGCPTNHLRKGDFSVDPSTNFDIYYVPNTYGDFYWSAVKGLFEERYSQFADLNKFTLPGKYSVYLCPCQIHSIIWDKRFGTMVDPTRNVVAAIFNRTFNSADPFIAGQVALMRQYGYAPPFLTEGFANYLSLAAFDMQEIVKAKKMPPLDSMLDTYLYLQAEPLVADRFSATFVRYLIDQYKIDKFIALYRLADDLTLRQSIESTYGKPVADLEKDWQGYLDTLTFRPQQFAYYSDMAEAMSDYPLMLKYASEYLSHSITPYDSVRALAQVVRACFFNGDYYKATTYQTRLVAMDTVTRMVVDRVGLAGYQMMNGYYDSAYTNLKLAVEADSLNQLVKFNLALNCYFRGDVPTARQILTRMIEAPPQQKESGPFAESRILLANMLLESKDSSGLRLAKQYFREANSQLSRLIQSHTHNPQVLMWSGIAYLGLGDTGNAQEALSAALYLETRPFYVGMIYLWMGKTADLRGERKVAREYYGKTLAQLSADYHQKEARRYLDEPYIQ
jgi:tetratricopeptide (TPR) repeat protein